MKRLISLLLLAAVTLLMGCGAEAKTADVAEETPFPEKAGLRIAVASDIHLNPDNTQKDDEATAVQYNMELVDALLWDAKRQGTDMILITGDLVNGGRSNRHEALVEKLEWAESTGMDVYVLPGNHDLAPITQSEFAQYYQDYGYAEAFSRDSVSLSYCVARDGLMILMMDTAGYSSGAIDLAEPPTADGPFLREETLLWAEEMLKIADAEGLRILSAGHYNLLANISRQEDSGFYVENGERFARMLEEHHAVLYLSGHTHVRAVYQENGLTELVTEYLLSYPTGYSMLDLSADGLRYLPRRIDVDGWAEELGKDDPVLLHYHKCQEDGLREYSHENIVYMSERNPLSRKEAKQAEEFFFTAMKSYWDGSMSSRRAELERMPGYNPFFRCAEGYAYGWWLKELIETAVPELAGFELKW